MDANYLHLRTLAAQLRAQLGSRVQAGTDLSVLDVGCGLRPYEPIFRPFFREYVGVDTDANSGADVVCPAEALPFPDERFDCLLCTQVLQYLPDPAAAVAEAWRVLKPGGLAFVSTHGVSNYHREPPDYWRWTQQGLERQIRAEGPWLSVDVYPNGGTASAIAYLIARQAEVLAERAHLRGPLRIGVFALNVAAWRADRAYFRRYGHRPPDLAVSYLAVARRSLAHKK